MSRALLVFLVVASVAATAVVVRPEGARAHVVSVLAAGRQHTCVVTTTSGVKCWGSNLEGELGIGYTCTPHGCAVPDGCVPALQLGYVQHCTLPADVAGLTSGVSSVSSKGDHVCALTSVGGVKCWGWNQAGELGNGTKMAALTPTDVVGLTYGATAVSAGYGNTCAITTTGGVKCWGSNTFGNVGNGTTSGPVTTPADVIGLSGNVLAISTGNPTCVLTTSNAVQCWGDNSAGQLGDGMSGNISTVPVTVTGLQGSAAAVSAGGGFACALTTSGGVKCWGTNYYGQLGIGTTNGPELCSGYSCSTTPVDVIGLSKGVASVSAGSDHACALKDSGEVVCWGYLDGAGGVLGNGVPTGSAVPVSVSGLAGGVFALDAGGDHACALMISGQVECWGGNFWGELGIGMKSGPEFCSSVPCSTVPATVSSLGPKPTSTPTRTAILTPTPPPAVGGISLDPAALPPRDAPGRSIELLLAVAGVAAVAGLAASAWYGRRRILR